MQSVDMCGSDVDILKFNADFAKHGNNPKHTNVVLRGGGSAVLFVFKHENKRYTVVVRQPSLPTCQSSLPEILTGKLDSDGNLSGAKFEEMKKATGMEINEAEFICLTQLAYGDKYAGMYPTCGDSDEHIQIYLKRQTISTRELSQLEKYIVDMNEECKDFQFQMCPLEQLWRLSPDAKALSALCLHDKLVAAGRIPEF
jgi:ADP-sugar diphosphatase